MAPQRARSSVHEPEACVTRCAIHHDAYDSSHICAACRRDPANAEWVAHVDAEAAANEPPRSARPRRAPPPSTCQHEWEPRSDLGRGCYTCRTCSVPGRRSVRTGAIRPNVRHEGYSEPPLTVDFKALNEERLDAFLGEGRSLLRRMHSNRSTANQAMQRALDVQSDVLALQRQHKPGHVHVWARAKHLGQYQCICGRRARKSKRTRRFVELPLIGPSIPMIVEENA